MKYLLWLGSYLTDDLAKKYVRLGYKNAASVVSQKNILEGMEQALGQRFDTIGMLTLAGFPVNKTIYVKPQEFCHAEGTKDLQVGYLNIRYLNRSTGERSMCRAVRKWMKKVDVQADQLDVYIYEMRSACLKAAKYIKRLMPSAKVNLIVPDLPQFMDLHMSWLKRTLKELDWKRICRNRVCVDQYILYTAPMAEFLDIPDDKWMLMEGSISQQEIKQGCSADEEQTNKTVVMYSGNINAQYGIMKLIEAFAYLSNEYELWITGSGPASEQVKRYAERDGRVKYYGFLPTREDLLALQKRASVFINMRDPSEKASAYCFPSKLFEYMLSGKPVLSCRLEGIPAEYFQYLIPMETFEPEGIAKAIQRVGAMTQQERIDLGRRQFDFISMRKTNLVQAKRIAAFVLEGKKC